ncbi:ABC transporter permease [Phytohabitans rumicis]|uniref:ABC transporter permease n=1 Tax=Phytohabitans rumicis TaxID=1076125 RepID=A0A6V8LRA1_9ACTN|nr:ABC transporter permease [Phytohabitans rumicis]GFJ96657.1 hypothetical protein Prum_102990 [Phytohabitans rumicis]
MAMYPELTAPLVVLLAAAAAFVAFLLLFRPVLRRLALRQVVRRPAELVLVVLGSLLGTALIVASLTVGDSLDRSVRQAAYDVLGPVDEYVRSPSAPFGDEVAARLAPLRADPAVDGLLTTRGDPAAALRQDGGQRLAEPRAMAWELDFAAAARFGAPYPSGLSVPDPGPGRAVVNEHLADSLDAAAGDTVRFYVYGRPLDVTVAAVVPAHGIAGMGQGATINRNAFFTPGTLTGLARAAGQQATTTTFVSNRGDVESGVALTDEVSARVRDLLGPLASRGAGLQTPKREVLDAAEQTGNALGALFLFVASFSIIAGVLLIVNIFVMLTEERKGQIGILRAIGMRRRRVSSELVIEGALYTTAAVLLGGVIGVALGRAVVVLALGILNGFNGSGNQLSVVFTVTPTSIVNGMAAGFLIALVAVALTSVRIARTNIIAAIRDLDASPRRRTRRRLTALSAAGTAVLAVASVPAVAAAAGAATYLLPALAAVAAIPLLRRFWAPKTAYTVVGFAVLGWGLTAHIARPHVFDDAAASTATYIVMGCMLTFGAVLLVSQHQALLLLPLRRLMRSPSETGLATRLAIAYPTAKRFRTGATLAMYCIVVFVIVLMTQISAIINAGVDDAVAEASAGWTLRADYNPSAAWQDPERAVSSGEYAGVVAETVTLVTAPALGDDPLGRGEDLPVLAVGMPDRLAASAPALQERLPAAPDDVAAWRLAASDPSYVIIDAFYGATGGPPGEPVRPGAAITVTDPQTGQQVARTVAGVMSNGIAFYGMDGGGFRYPVLMSQAAIGDQFGAVARPSSLLLRLDPGSDPGQVAARLQGQFLTNGLVVTDLAQSVRDNFAANQQFFTLMRGYLGLGLFVGVAGLGVVMVRAVRERRRTIAVLRALGFKARTVRRSIMGESTFVALEGVIIGTVLGVLTTWLLYQNSPMFGSLDVPFPIAWGQIALTVGATLVASLLATVGPARRAARIRPAVALRIAD